MNVEGMGGAEANPAWGGLGAARKASRKRRAPATKGLGEATNAPK